MKLNLLVVASAAILLLNSCGESSTAKSSDPNVKNIIFLIGDGMGVAQVYSAMLNSEEKINMEKSEFSGFATTFSLTQKITDSAASGTAMSTGNKTKNGVIGQDTLGNAYTTILEIAEKNGLATGLVATVSIAHATPASFIAHENSRGDYEAIAADFLDTDIDLFIGGGYNHFANRKDSVNYIDSLVANGYEVARSMEDVEASNSEKLAGLVFDSHGPSYLDGRGDMLPRATKKALEILSKNEKGFFLMIEGSQIDWACHDNDAQYAIEETLDFDRALGVVLEFLKENPNTLVVVTADHETGGMTIPGTQAHYKGADVMFSSHGHTAVMVPIFSYGAGAELFSGIMDNTEFFPKFIKLYGFENE